MNTSKGLTAIPGLSWNALADTTPLARELTAAGLFVSAVNPRLISNYQDEDNALRRIKSDKTDSVKIARYTLDLHDCWRE